MVYVPEAVADQNLAANWRRIAPQSLVAVVLRSLRAGRKPPHLRRKRPRCAGGGGNDAMIDPRRYARVMGYSHGQATGHSRRAAHRQATGGQATAMQGRFRHAADLASRVRQQQPAMQYDCTTVRVWLHGDTGDTGW